MNPKDRLTLKSLQDLKNQGTKAAVETVGFKEIPRVRPTKKIYMTLTNQKISKECGEK
jgi:phosphoribosylformylglycinamidine (FGAM) synthase PurS component